MDYTERKSQYKWSIENDLQAAVLVANAIDVCRHPTCKRLLGQVFSMLALDVISAVSVESGHGMEDIKGQPVEKSDE